MIIWLNLVKIRPWCVSSEGFNTRSDNCNNIMWTHSLQLSHYAANIKFFVCQFTYPGTQQVRSSWKYSKISGFAWSTLLRGQRSKMCPTIDTRLVSSGKLLLSSRCLQESCCYRQGHRLGVEIIDLGSDLQLQTWEKLCFFPFSSTDERILWYSSVKMFTGTNKIPIIWLYPDGVERLNIRRKDMT